MILGIGTDLVSLKRIQRVLDLYDNRFIEKICHPDEISYLIQDISTSVIPALTAKQSSIRGDPIISWHSKHIRFLASSFAVKEALAKACGTGFSQGLWFSQICVSRREEGAPYLTTSGPFEQYLRTLKVSKTHVSVSYEKDFCHALVILEDR